MQTVTGIMHSRVKKCGSVKYDIKKSNSLSVGLTKYVLLTETMPKLNLTSFLPDLG